MSIQQANVLGVGVNQLTIPEVEKIIDHQVTQTLGKPLFLVTAYSEFFLEAGKHVRFRDALKKADYLLPDGVSVLEAIDYLSLPKSSVLGEFLQGIKIGVKTVSGKYSKRTSGVTLVRKLLEEKKYKIFLLGGWNGVGEKLAKRYDAGFFEGPRSITGATAQEYDETIKAVKAYKPDILLVSFGRFNQEIWIAEHLDQLSTKVVIGVGSAFDEILGEGKWAKKVPSWVERSGLKWLWRLTTDPSHIKRIPHIPQFAWAVFLQKLSS